ncbi:MAG: hypothetical protein KTR16_14360 [Acidiferrobacterales bacterium]|nr:hypothetical protein [Acidiferrobacterales bacterium]
MNSLEKISVNIICALNCEAKTLIDHYRLSKRSSKPFDWYFGKALSSTGREFSINLLVSGIGCQNMAVACGWLAAQTGGSQSIWLNIGTAGHKDIEVGRIVRVCRSVAVDSGKSHYPAMTAKWSGLSQILITHASECIDYPVNAMVDMEGAEFFRAAGMFASSELVQSLKIISDNESDGIERLNASLISELIAPNVETISGFASSLISLLPYTTDHRSYFSKIEHMHCTVSQRQQYSDLLIKLGSLHRLDNAIDEQIENANAMSDVLTSMSHLLMSIQPNIQIISDSQHG